MYVPTGSFEVAQGMARLHLDPRYRTMLLDEGIKPVFRVSNLDGARTKAMVEDFRARGYYAAPCHEGFDFDEKGLYAFEDGRPLYYLFVTTSQERLDEMLAVDKRQKTADNAETKLESALHIGRLLGYPECCSRFYASFPVNPHQTTFLWRPWQATTGAIGRLQHPTLRPLGHFGCSLHCPVTEERHTRILAAMKRHLPEVAEWVEPAFQYPVLLFDHGATVFAGTGTDGRVDYGRAWHIGEPRGAEESALREDLDSGDRVEVVGGRIRVFRAGAPLGDHDTRSFSLLPLLIPVDDQPVAKRVRHAAVPAWGERARYLAGDLLHMGHRVDWTRAPKGPADAWATAVTEAGIDTVVLDPETDRAYGEAARAREIAVVVVGGTGPDGLPAERHGFAHAFERWSRGLGYEADFPLPAPGPDLARPDWMWPSQLLEDPLEGNRRQARTHRLQDPGGADRLEALVAQVRQHQGDEVVVPEGCADVLEVLVSRLSDPIRLRLESPLAPARLAAVARAAPKHVQLRVPAPREALDAAVGVLQEKAPGVFAEVAVEEGPVALGIRCETGEGPALHVTPWRTGTGWQLAVDRSAPPTERRWLAALKALLARG